MIRDSRCDDEAKNEQNDFAVDDLAQQPRRSGIITATAVIGIVVGGVALLFASCTGISAHNSEVRVGFSGTRGVEKVFTVEIILFLAWGVLAMVAGIGLLHRHQWARILALVLAGVAGLAGLGEVVFGIFLSAGNPVPQAAPFLAPQGLPFLLLFFLVKMVFGMVLFSYCLWNSTVLLIPRNVSEFRDSSGVGTQNG
jgi:hypothetical protein